MIEGDDSYGALILHYRGCRPGEGGTWCHMLIKGPFCSPIQEGPCPVFNI